MKWARFFPAVTLLVPTLLFAQAQGRVKGVVKDSKGKPITTAAVVITCPEISNFRKDIKVDDKGGFATLIVDATKQRRRVTWIHLTQHAPAGTDEEILDWVARDAETALHPSCTAKMGTDALAVVDPTTMGVHGVDGLRVVDASIMPTITSGNTNAPTIMIAEKAVDVIREEERGAVPATVAA